VATAHESNTRNISRLGRDALIILGASGAIIATALAFEHLGGYRPCPLCLQERYAYYAAIGAGFGAWLAPRGLARVLLALIAAGFLINTGLGIYHSGAEWKFWPGPATCGGGLAPLTIGRNLDTPAIRCDEAPWRFLGLSFAGWNAMMSLALFVYASASVWRDRTATR
jgi:disulfide bond formation protein DsbB